MSSIKGKRGPTAGSPPSHDTVCLSVLRPHTLLDPRGHPCSPAGEALFLSHSPSAIQGQLVSTGAQLAVIRGRFRHGRAQSQSFQARTTRSIEQPRPGFQQPCQTALSLGHFAAITAHIASILCPVTSTIRGVSAHLAPASLCPA